MGWDNPPVPWRDLRQRMSWPAEGQPPAPEPARLQPVPPAPERTEPAGPPWAELHCHSSYSFLDGASTPGELVAEAARLGLQTLAITDHDGMYGVPQFAQAAARLAERGGRLRTVFGAELSLGLPPGPRGSGGDGSPQERGGPGGSPPRGTQQPSAGAGPRPGGLPQAVRGDQRRPAGGRAEGTPGLRPGRTGRRARRSLGGADRLPQGAGPGRAGGRRPGRGLGGAGPADRDVRPPERAGRAELPPRSRRRRAQRRPGPAGRGRRRRPSGHRQRPLRGARPSPAGPGPGRDPGPAQPG